jgi:hypothetical protein
MNSIFQLADQWTGSTDIDEYVDFLSRSYTIVFQDLDEADELQYPDEWKPHLTGKSIQALSGPAADELALELYRAKFTADNIAVDKGDVCPSFGEVSLDYIKSKYGAAGGKRLKQKMKVFAKALANCNATNIGSQESHSDWLWLFSRLVGCYTPSGRIKGIPATGVSFVCGVLEEIAAMSMKTHLKLPSSCQTPEMKSMKAGKNSTMVGYVGLPMAEKWLGSIFARLKLNGTSSADVKMKDCVFDVLRHSTHTYEEATGAAGGDHTVDKMTTAADLFILVANLWCATLGDTAEAAREAAKAKAG